MRNVKAIILGVLLGSYAGSPVWALDIAQVPLFQSTTVSPNVMLLIDNSGSMNHITWKESYQDSTTYPAVEGCVSDTVGVCSSWITLAAGATYYRGSFLQLDCASDQRKFRYGVTERCLFMPDPLTSGNTRFKGNYLSYLVGQNVSDSDIPTEHRMKVARDVSKSLVVNNPGMRFGVMSFDPADNADGGKVLAGVGSSVSTINTNIDGLLAETWTPLAEAYYEMTRYYRGLSANYTVDTSTSPASPIQFTSPIQYRCQKNFGIVVTDGLPTYDTTFPSNDPDAGSRLPDWDGVGEGQSVGVQYSDGPGGGEDGEGHYLYLDDIAKFAYDTDLRTAGTDQAHVSFNDPDFLKQNLMTYTVGFAVDNQMLRDAAELGHGEYYTANSAAQLNTVLSRALQSIKNQTSSAAAIATNSTRLDTNTLIYQARFNSSDWSGELIAYGINANGSVGNDGWRTSDTGKIPAAGSRNIFSHNGSAGIAFSWSNLSVAQKAALKKPADTDADGEVRLNWLRGANSGASLSTGEVLRARTANLGDIVNSDPVFVGAQNYGYTTPNDVLVTTEPADSYQAYLDAKSAGTKVIMVGSNDGMMHALNAETGVELFAYVPSSIYSSRTITPGSTPGLRVLTESGYAHKYFVDGSIGVGDVYVGDAWKTYAVGLLGAGGRGVYALDISTPNSFTASNVLWEATAPDADTASNDWNDLGYTFGVPVIARTQNDTWVAIFGNGYDSNSGRAALYVVNAATGHLIKKIPTAATDTGNGLSAPAVIVDANRRVTMVYAGDLKGNLWKFDLNNSNDDNWGVAYSSGSGNSAVAAPLFTARNAAGQVQPITSGLEVGSHPSGGLMVYFGTGKYFENSDNVVGASPQIQSFYGIWDKSCNTGNCADMTGGRITSTNRSLLQVQSITHEVTDTNADYRVTTTNTVDWTAKRGWYMNLVPPSGTAQGERAVSLPLLRAGRIIFPTVIPSTDPCLAGGNSWLMELDAFSGGRLNYAVFDKNDDGNFNAGDKVACEAETCDASGRKSSEGIIKTPGIISAGETEYKYAGGSSGNILVVKEKGSLKEGRMSWRQLR